MVERPPAGTVPDAPGSYQFRDEAGRVIYVGKARSLRQRLSNYFADPATLHPRTAQMVAVAATVEWIQVRNEVEALMLEYALIKEHRPRFNVRLVDDKSYPYLAITMLDEWPRPMVMRGARRKGNRYFGPYAHAYAIRETLDLLLRTFPVRTCSDNKLARHTKQGRPCLLFHIEKCAAPCIGAIDRESYDVLVAELTAFLEGDTEPVIARLEAEMAAAAEALEFEQAARCRDRLASVHRAIEKQQMVADNDEDLDIIGIAEDELEAAVQVFHVRRGRVMGRKGLVLDKVLALEEGEVVARVLEELYGEDPPTGTPRTVLVPTLPDDADVYERWLSDRRGGRVAIRVPHRGDKRRLLETVTRNATEEFQRHRLRRASDHNSRARALNELQEALGLPEAPLRIECFDMSHIQGTDYVGSMVVMTDGLPDKREYRRFKVRTVGGSRIGDSNDVAAMREVLSRRFENYLADRGRPIEERGRFQYPPQLLVVDGGKGQLNVASAVLEELGLDEEIPVCSLAKQFEEVYLPGRPDPVRIPRQSEALFMLQRIRDESHRFVITYHRELRNKRMTTSVLDGIPGLGERRKSRLIKELGGVRAVKAADIETLRALTWLPDPVADAVHEKVNPVLDVWEQHADWWQREFTDGVDPEYVEQILPLIAESLPEAGTVLDVGCGEGQVARLAAGRGLHVVGVDPAFTQVSMARARGGGASYVQGVATSLPVRNGVVDLAIGARLVFEHIEDLDAAVAETARAVVAGGRFLFLLNHPLLQTPGSGWIDDHVLDPPEQYWRIGPYLVEGDNVEEVTKGVFIRFFHRPLGRYLNSLADHGFVLRRMHEPAPPAGFLEAASEYEEAATIPRLLALELQRER